MAESQLRGIPNPQNPNLQNPDLRNPDRGIPTRGIPTRGILILWDPASVLQEMCFILSCFWHLGGARMILGVCFHSNSVLFLQS